jgi:hypothetical protein
MMCGQFARMSGISSLHHMAPMKGPMTSPNRPMAWPPPLFPSLVIGYKVAILYLEIFVRFN